MSKINIVRSIKSKNIKDEINHNREIGWDNRFHLAKLQPYDANQDAYFVNMKLLREQFKILEQSYKNTKPTFYLNDKRYKPNIINNKNSEIGNSILNNTNLHGSYNNINIYNEKENKNYFVEENTMNDPFMKDLNKIINLWDDLGVTDNYRVIFENLSRDIDPLMRKDLFENEISALRKFSELLFNISKEIEQREILITQIHQIDQAFLGIDSKDEILTELVSNLKNVRIASINIISYLQKIREQCSYNVLGGKFNLDKINIAYKFDKNYLIKMKFDMDFLRNSKLATYFEFEPCESDPFLLYFYFKNEKFEKKFGMRISDDMLSAVKQGQYLILQDLIFFNINSIYMKNIQKENRNLNKIKGIYGRDFSQPKTNNNTNTKNFGATSSRLYSPPKKPLLNDIRPSTTATGFNNLIRNTNGNLMNQNNKNNIENQFEATSTNFFKINNMNNSIKVPKIHNKEEIKKINPSQNIQNYNNDKNYNNLNENFNYLNIQNEFLNPIQIQNPRGQSLNNKEIPNNVNNYSNNMNQNYMNNGFQMNMYQNQQINQIPYNNFNNNNLGNYSNMYNPFMTNMPMNYQMMNSQNLNYNNPFANNQNQQINNNSSGGFNNFNNNSNLIISSMNKIEIIPSIIKRQNTEKSIHDNSKIIKVKSEDIVAIDKKNKNNIIKKIEDSSMSIRTEEDNIKSNNKKENFNDNNKIKKMDISASNHSRFSKKLEDDFSIQDEIEYQKPEKKITEKSLKNNDIENNQKALKNKSESDIQEENSNMENNHNKLKSKKSLKAIKNNDSIDEDINNEKNFNREENKNNLKNYSDKNVNQVFEDSFKKSIKNNSNISENLSYKTDKKIKKEIKTSFNEDMNNKENSIDDIIDSKSLKDIENEIHSDFKNDQPVIEESKKSIELRDHTSPKGYVSQQSRLATENKFDKLEIINEESMDKSKSNLKEINNKNNFYDKKENYENENMDMEIYEDEKFDNNNNFENSAISKSSKNLSRNKNKEKPQANVHETFDSLKSHTIKSQKEFNEENAKTKNITDKKLPEIIKTEENYEFDKKEEKEKSKISDEAQEEIEDESKEIEEKSILDNEGSRLSKYSTVSKKNKAAGKISKQIFEELKQKALVVCIDPSAENNAENNKQKDLNKSEEVVEENFNQNNISQNKSLLKNNSEKVDELDAEEAKQIFKKDDNEILEEENLEKEDINKSIQDNIQIENKHKNLNENEEMDFYNNEKKKEDPDAIEEENHLANEEKINKSFKSKKSIISNKKEITENDKIENIQINKDNNDIPFEENIIEEEFKGKDIVEKKNSENDIEQDDKICEIPRIENKESKQKGSFNDLKNQIKINFLAGEDIKECNLQYKTYIEKLNSEQQITFKPKESIIEYLNLFNSKIIKITKNGEKDLIGLCCLSYDNTWEDSIKLNIDHISFLHFEFFEELVDLILSFIKENFNFIDEIIIELHYEYKDSNFEINKEIRDLFKNKFNFKWNKLENKNEERIQKMSLNLNREPSETKNDYGRFMHSTLEINHFTVLNLANKENNNENDIDPSNPDNNYDQIVNLNYFSLVSSLCQMENTQNKINSEMLEKYDKNKIKRLCRNFITLVNQENEQDKENYEKLKKILPEQILNENSAESSNKNILSLMKLNLKFNSLSTHAHNKYIYNRIHGSISTLINEELNHKFFVILTADGNYTILITEMTNGFKDFLINNKNENIYKLFDGLYNNLKNTSADESAMHIENKSIWIPSFVNKKDYNLIVNSSSETGENNSFSLIDELRNTNIENIENGEHKTIRKISESYNSIFRFDKDYTKNPALNPLEDDIVINDTFLISVINLDILADSHISTVFLSIINKELWMEN